MALPRARRLPRGADFDALYRSGAVIHSPFFVLRARPNPAAGPRWGFAVSKRVSKRAVDRNRLRRLLAEAVAAQGGHVPAADYVVNAKSRALEASYSDLRDAIRGSVQRATRAITENEEARES